MAYNYGTTIIDFDKDWGEVNNESTGKEIQDFIKHHLEKIDNKVGYFHNVDGGNLISYLLGFEDKTDYDKWVEKYQSNDSYS